MSPEVLGTILARQLLGHGYTDDERRHLAEKVAIVVREAVAVERQRCAAILDRAGIAVLRGDPSQ